MTGKRRRERDRPKAAPDLGYNPNKRVLLSYSDAEDGDKAEDEYTPEPGPVTSKERNPVNEDELANYQITPYEENEEVGAEDDDDAASVGVDEAKGFEEVDTYTQLKQPVKSRRNAHRRKQQQTLGRNKSTNQKPALGSMAFQYDDGNDEGDSDDYNSETEGAMAYLKSVRVERQTLPTVLFAAREEEHDSAQYDDGYVSEDAYIGRPTVKNAPSTLADSVDAREAFDSLLKRRFLRQRALLHSENTRDGDNPEADGEMSAAQWTTTLRTTPPFLHRLQSLDEHLTFRLLSILQRRLLRHDRDISPATSCWAWALLARLEEVGTMNNDQVSAVREFGKKAVLVLTCLTTPAAAEQLVALEDDSVDGDNDGSHGDSPEPEPIVNDAESKDATMATLDSIITLVGDVFGQRDLLEFRRPWSEKPSHVNA